jgi:hypothetical protein
MFRVTFLINEPGGTQLPAPELRVPDIGCARVISAFRDAKAIDVFFNVESVAGARDVAASFATQLGIPEYEVTQVESLPIGAGEPGVSDRASRRPDAITQVRVHPDDRTVSVQVRHRPHETVAGIETVETLDDAVAITVSVATRDEHAADQYASLAIAFTWIDTVLDRPLGDRKIVRHAPAADAAPTGLR